MSTFVNPRQDQYQIRGKYLYFQGTKEYVHTTRSLGHFNLAGPVSWEPHVQLVSIPHRFVLTTKGFADCVPLQNCCELLDSNPNCTAQDLQDYRMKFDLYRNSTVMIVNVEL